MVRIGRERVVPFQQGDPAQRVSLYVTTLRAHRDPVAFAYVSDFGADNSHNDQRLYAIQPRSLAAVQTFRSAEDAEFYSAMRNHGMRVVTLTTWHVWWPDVYEWNGRRFVLANRRSPNFYRKHLKDRNAWAGGDDDYGTGTHRAAIQTIVGSRSAALAACQKSALAFAQLIRKGGSDPPFAGDDRINLKEIRQRIRCLRDSDLDHALLYRPYDFDLQVPPYRLVTASRRQSR